jgi:hypothetical protein
MPREVTVAADGTLLLLLPIDQQFNCVLNDENFVDARGNPGLYSQHLDPPNSWFKTGPPQKKNVKGVFRAETSSGCHLPSSPLRSLVA